MATAKMILLCKIDVKKIDKTELYVGEKGTYLDLALIETGPGQYGDDGFISQQLSRATRESDPDRRGSIIGNWRWHESGRQAQEAATEQRATERLAAAKGEAADDDSLF